MKDYKQRITDCIDHLNTIRFPCEDWKEDKKSILIGWKASFHNSRKMKKQERYGMH